MRRRLGTKPRPLFSLLSALHSELPYFLGAANPRRNALHAEPFLTSVYKVPICIVATATKICTKGHSS